MEKQPPSDHVSSALANWLPIRLKHAATGLHCEWLYTDGKKFSEPFFDETMAACKYTHANNRRYKVISDLRTMIDWSRTLSAVAPTAIIFHVSRCGSTLLSQLLSEDTRNIVLSEVPFFDEILRMPLQTPFEEMPATEECLRAALKYYGQRQHPRQERLVIKADSWHLLFYEQYRKLFPDLPFFFLYRSPLPVIHSQQKQRGIHSVPGLIEPSVFGFTREEANDTDLDRYMARVLEKYFQAMARILASDPLAYAFDFDNGINGIVNAFYSQQNALLKPELSNHFAERCRYHAKRPTEIFTEKQQGDTVPDYLETAFSLYMQLKEMVG